MNNIIALSVNEKFWYDTLKTKMQEQGIDYYISWWLSKDIGVKTARVNYWLTKLVDKGLLRKETSCYCSKYFLI